VVWRRATLSGVVFVLRSAPQLESTKAEVASIIQLSLSNALPPLRSVGIDAGPSGWERRHFDR
jgi:hypothetical protein